MSMYNDFINASNFDSIFNQILAIKKGKNVVYSRLILDGLSLLDRVHFLVDYINSIEGISGVTYKILFWEKEMSILNVFNMCNIQAKDVKVHRSYMNTDIPGELFYNEMILNENLSRLLINMHFNFEHAIEPSFNGRIQICLNRIKSNIFLDIYDDRGCDVYFLWK